MKRSSPEASLNLEAHLCALAPWREITLGLASSRNGATNYGCFVSPLYTNTPIRFLDQGVDGIRCGVVPGTHGAARRFAAPTDVVLKCVSPPNHSGLSFAGPYANAHARTAPQCIQSGLICAPMSRTELAHQSPNKFTTTVSLPFRQLINAGETPAVHGPLQTGNLVLNRAPPARRRRGPGGEWRMDAR